MKKSELRELSAKTLEEVFNDFDSQSENPIVTWDHFIDLLDTKVRRNIRNTLEKSGLNRYTGEPKGVNQCG